MDCFQLLYMLVSVKFDLIKFSNFCTFAHLSYLNAFQTYSFFRKPVSSFRTLLFQLSHTYTFSYDLVKTENPFNKRRLHAGTLCFCICNKNITSLLSSLNLIVSLQFSTASFFSGKYLRQKRIDFQLPYDILWLWKHDQVIIHVVLFCFVFYCAFRFLCTE